MKRQTDEAALHPNPAFCREDFQLLNGAWQFCFGDETESAPLFQRTITVPFSYECLASGIGEEEMRECVWYRRKVDVKPWKGRLLLHFEAVDYYCEVFVNGRFAAAHSGGYTAFSADITEFAEPGENEVTVMVRDSFAKSQLRGKQRAGGESHECWYVQTTGIWKSVWLEYCGETVLKNFRIVPENSGKVTFTGRLTRAAAVTVRVRFEGECVAERVIPAFGNGFTDCFVLSSPKLWGYGHPALYRVEITVSGNVPDTVETYFAFREVACRTDGLYVNGERCYLKMILDQGYWRDSMLTAPSAAALERDVRAILEMGFNGVRMHQKVESYLFYYYCDLYGLYVWGEVPSAYEFSGRMRQEMRHDAHRIVRQLSPFPSVVSWVVFNESWGIPDIRSDRETQKFAEEVLSDVRHWDSSRPVVINDGWHQIDGDILSLHEYEQDCETLRREYADKRAVVGDKVINTYGKAFAENYSYSGQPVMLSEFGGVAMAAESGWGYGESAKDLTAFRERVRNMFRTVRGIGYLSGYCYTQLTDVQQEVNGLMTEDHRLKLPAAEIRAMIEGGET